MSNISDNALSKMRIARAYVQILCILEDRSEASASLASIGNCEIRMFVGSKAHSDGMSLSWMELFEHGAKASVDSYSCHKIEDAVAVFEDFHRAGRSFERRYEKRGAELVIWNSSSSHYKVALQTLEESACGECRCERPADRALGAECAGASVLGEASPSSPCCAVAI